MHNNIEKAMDDNLQQKDLCYNMVIIELSMTQNIQMIDDYHRSGNTL